MAEIKIVIDDRDLAKIVKATPVPFVCKGASGDASETPAFLELVKAPRSTYDCSESYVLCPRLRPLFTSHKEFRCYEGELKLGTQAELRGSDQERQKQYEEGQKRYKEQLEKSLPCPYFNPAEQK